MGIAHDRIAQLHPVLYHMAEFGTWNSICKHGLLSTTALLDLFGISSVERSSIEASLRRVPITIHDKEHGLAVLRDQRPMSDSKLAKCLRDGLRPTDWYRLLNGKVFFWLTEERLITLMKAYSDAQQLVLEVDTKELLQRHGDQVMLTPMNTGTTSPIAFPRGLGTFQSPERYRFEMNRKKKGGEKKAIVELTVSYSVPKIVEFVIRATHRRFKDGETVITETIFKR
jgi:hypothetical protein